jgi:hypothetical protein
MTSADEPMAWSCELGHDPAFEDGEVDRCNFCGKTRLEPMREDFWYWCNLHDLPVVHYDPAGDPYCWGGVRNGEVDECAENLIRVRLSAIELPRLT